ncbi:MAG: histidinol dehydrogenase [Candidatus Acidiferrales bacterium]|jgi:histidinol dehydrogenase
MRLVRLTTKVEKALLAGRQRRYAGAERIAARIVNDVRRRGDAALFPWTKRLDGTVLRGEGVWITPNELRSARRNVSDDFVRALLHASKNIRRVALSQMPKSSTLRVEPGVTIKKIVRPIETIGCYIPGGRYALVSTLLMTVIPAQVAGVKRIVVVCPRPNHQLLAAAALLGVTEIARIGGAQAIAALACGTRSVPRVEKIFGPGNRFVTAAKQLVSADCAIDLPAGPTEAMILATRGNARWIAADLLAQAEHAPDAGSFLVTTSAKLANDVQREISSQLARLQRDNPAHESTARKGAILIATSISAAVDFVNRFAPEHLTLIGDARRQLANISAAGTIFLGEWSAQPIGDYASGSNHVLPTGGWARRRGGLSAVDFVKCVNVQTIDRKGFARVGPVAAVFARAEGLLAHEAAIAVRR